MLGAYLSRVLRRAAPSALILLALAGIGVMIPTAGPAVLGGPLIAALIVGGGVLLLAVASALAEAGWSRRRIEVRAPAIR